MPRVLHYLGSSLFHVDSDWPVSLLALAEMIRICVEAHRHRSKITQQLYITRKANQCFREKIYIPIWSTSQKHVAMSDMLHLVLVKFSGS